MAEKLTFDKHGSYQTDFYLIHFWMTQKNNTYLAIAKTVLTDSMMLYVHRNRVVYYY